MTRRKAAMVAMAVLLAAPASAQEGVGQLHGTVLDAGRKGVVGLSVALVPESGAVVYGATTDGDGRYAFKGLAAGSYSVVVLPPGGRPLRKDGIRVRPVFRSIVDFNTSIEKPADAIPGPRAGPPAAGGDGSLSIASIVTGPDRTPVPDAAVSLTPIGGAGSAARARAGADGNCRIEGLAPGSYLIAVSAPGFIGWMMGPMPLSEAGDLRIEVSMTSFPMGFTGTVEDLLVPAEPIPPAGASPPAPQE